MYVGSNSIGHISLLFTITLGKSVSQTTSRYVNYSIWNLLITVCGLFSLLRVMQMVTEYDLSCCNCSNCFAAGLIGWD